MNMTRLAVSSLVLGFFFMRFVYMEWWGIGITLYTFVYVAAVLWALRSHKVKVQAESYFWLGVLLLTALSYSLWTFAHSILMLARALLLFTSAVYWVLVACGMNIKQVTSDYLPLDAWHGFVSVPLGNFRSLWRQLSVLGTTRKQSVVVCFQVVAGVVLSGIFLAVLVPLLLGADIGGFGRFVTNLDRWLPRLDTDLIWHLMLALPTGAYIFGLLEASIGGRRRARHNEDSVTAAAQSWPSIPVITAYVAATLLLGTYAVFLSAQWPVLVAAVSGETPAMPGGVAAYARQGFFELCIVAFINLSLLAGASLLTRGTRYITHLGVAFSLVTLILSALAWSRLTWYVHLFGLTIDRVLAGTFLLGLAVVFLAIILRAKYRFSIMRVASFTASAMLLVLLLSGPQGHIASYNAERYLAGTLRHFDTSVLFEAGVQGVGVALRLREHPLDSDVQHEIDIFLRTAATSAFMHAGTRRDTYDAWRVRRLLPEAEYRQWPQPPSSGPRGE